MLFAAARDRLQKSLQSFEAHGKRTANDEERKMHTHRILSRIEAKPAIHHR